MPAELKRTAGRDLYRSEPGHLQPRTADGRIIKHRQLISAIACLLPAAVLAGPKNGQVVAGEAVISTPDANTTVIRQSTNKSVINWQSFSIGSQEYVKIVQPDQSSLSLNRVIGGNPSSILGQLSSNGQVYLVNPNGIYFGQGAQVDVSAIVASVRDIGNTDFMNGKFVFQGDASENLGTVINDGIINARNAGYVVLLGDYTENNGVIQAHMGKVVLASGSHITMDISGNNLISVAVNEATVNNLAGVKNSGEIYADGGRVIMTARVADNLIGSAVNNQGLVHASSIVEKDGAIFLTASGGNIVNSGTLDASAAVGSNVDGGGVLVYSDRDITLASGGAINARGDGEGAGGMVRVIAEDVLDFQSGASITVAGGPKAGGFVEVSGHDGIKLRGDIDAGDGGSLLIDPDRLNINSGAGGPGVVTSSTFSVGKGFIESQLTTSNVTLVATTLVTSVGGFGITTTGAAVGNLSIINGTVSAGGSLGGPTAGSQCNSAGFCINPGGVGSFGVTQGAGAAAGNILLGNVSFTLNGSLTIDGGTNSGTVEVGDIDAGGNVAITAGGNVNLQGNISAAGSSLAVSAGGDIAVDGSIGIATPNGLLPLAADVNMNAGNDINVDGDIVVGDNSQNLFADAGVPNGAGDVNITGRGSCSDGCFGEPRTVQTVGDLNVTGQNFNVNGADFGSGGVSTDQNVPVNVNANRVIVDINGNMNVMGGRVNLDVQLGTSGAGGTSMAVDTSVKVTGTSLVDITANNLTVQGGTAGASVSGTFFSSSVQAKANAQLATGGNITLTLGGSLNVNAGDANAAVFDKTSKDFATAEANASVTAGGAVTIVAPGGVSVLGGAAQVDARGIASFSEGPKAEANATIDAGGSLGITVANGNLLIQAGNASATVTFSSGSFMSASASANARVQSGGATTVAITTGGLSVLGGTASAQASASNSNDASAFAHANADLQVAGNLNVDSVGTDIAIGGGAAIARIPGNTTGNSTCSTCGVQASANAKVQAGAVTITNVGGDLDLSAGFANAGISVNNYVESSAQMQANADASLTAGSVDITVTGTLTVAGGFALAGGSWTSGTVRIAAHADALLEAVSTDLMLTASAVQINGGLATIGGASSVSGDNATIDATAKGEIIAARDVVIDASNGLIVGGGQAAVSFVTAVGTISADANACAKVQAGRDMDLTVTVGSINVQGGTANANPASSGGTGGTASASAKAELKAGGQATVIVTAGSVSLIGGFSNPGGSSYSSGSPRAVNRGGSIGSAGLAVTASAARPSGSSGSMPLRKASANASITADQLQMTASANINGSFASIDANGIYLSAGNNINLSNTITTVGNGTAGVSGDSLVLDILDRANIGLPANNSPNALFEAGGSLFTGDVNMSASNGYLWFSADQLSVGSISAPAGPLLVQYSPFTPTHNIAFEDLPASPQPQQVSYDNLQHVASLPITTLAIGSAEQSGPMTVGANGTIDIGAKNILLLTTPDNVTSPANVITSGIVATSGFVASVREEVDVYLPPRLEDMDVEVDNWWLEAERRKQQLVDAGENNHGMCTAL